MEQRSPVLPGRLLDVFWIVFLAMIMIPVLVGSIAGLFGRVLGSSLPAARLDQVSAILAMVAQELALGGLTIGVVIKDGYSLGDLGLRFDNWVREVLLGLALGVGLTAVNVAGEQVSMRVLRLVLGDPIVRQLWERENTNILVQFLDRSQPLWIVVSSFLLVTVVAPVVEEIFFRGYGYAVIKYRVGADSAVFISAFLFAAIHFYVINFLPVFLLGLVLAYVYERRRSLVAPIVAHSIANGLVVLFLWMG